LVLLALVVSAQAAAPPPARLDRHGDPLPPGVLTRLGTVRLRLGEQYPIVALSPDQKTLATSGEEHVHFWDFTSGKLVRSVRTIGQNPTG
jgi:hypothetical protein